MHAVELARQLAIPQVIIPPEPGNFSALGMLLSDYRVDRSLTFVRGFNEATVKEALELADSLRQGIEDEIHSESASAEVQYQRYVEIRYKGQVHSVRTQVPPDADAQSLRDSFEQLYRRRYGHADSRAALELVSVTTVGLGLMEKPDLNALTMFDDGAEPPPPTRRSVYLPSTGRQMATVYARKHLPRGFCADGPALIEEYGSTTLVSATDRFTVGALGEIRIDLGMGEAKR